MTMIIICFCRVCLDVNHRLDDFQAEWFDQRFDRLLTNIYCLLALTYIQILLAIMIIIL